MKSNLQTEVLVVGAGPVGLLNALFLAANGIHVRLIDQAARTASRSYACALHPRSIQLLDHAGIAGEAIALGWPVDGVGFYEGIRRCAGVKLGELPVPFPFALVLPQAGLEEYLEERLRQLPNVHFDWNHALADLQTDGTSATATINRMAPTAKGYASPEFEMVVDKQFTLRAEFVVGADGARSLTRQRLGIGARRIGQPQRFVVYQCSLGGPVGHEMRVALHEGTLNAMWPLAEQKCRWSFQLPALETPADFPAKDRSPFDAADPEGLANNRAEMDRLLRERAPWFKIPVENIEWSTVVQFDHWMAREFGRGRCWLVGDAAHQSGPVGMQSMNAGLTEAESLASIIAKMLRRGGGADLLTQYEQMRIAEWESLLGLGNSRRPPARSPAWLAQHYAALPECLPAAGSDLAALLNQLSGHTNWARA